MVLDASVLANVVGDDGPDGWAARQWLRAGVFAVPDLADVETVAVLRKRWLAGDISSDRFDLALNDLVDLDCDRYPAWPLLRRVGELRANLTAYDAVYVALAEALDCALLTADAKLAGAPGLPCQVEVLRGS